MSVTDIKQNIRYSLWGTAAGRCEFLGCNRVLKKELLTKRSGNFADFAHIIGDSENGPRGNAINSKKYSNDIENLMLLCLDHHRLVDRAPELYTPDLLRKMKEAHEERIRKATGVDFNRTSQVILFTERIGELEPKISYKDAISAMNGDWYPLTDTPIILGLHDNQFEDCEKDYWEFVVNNLQRQFLKNVSPLLNSATDRLHFSIFALAPQPVLIKFGSLLPDIYPAEVYQCHREPPFWNWRANPDSFQFIVTTPSEFFPNVAINLSLSATIENDRIKKAFGTSNYSEWNITIHNPNVNFLQSKHQLQIFRNEFRALLNNIKSAHGEQAVINIFPAVPNAIAVEMGRIWQPKADLPLRIFDQNKKNNGFSYALTIGDQL